LILIPVQLFALKATPLRGLRVAPDFHEKIYPNWTMHRAFLFSPDLITRNIISPAAHKTDG